MRLSLILTVCVMSSRLLGDLQAADDLDLPTETRAVVQDAQSKPIDWKQRSGEVQQLIAPPKLDFEKVGYQIGDVNALKALLGQSNSLPIFSATGTQGSERAFGFGSETLTWSGVKWESKADAPAASGTIEQVSHQEFPGLSQDLSVGTGLPTPEQIFDVPVDPLVRDYTAAPRRWTDLLPDSLWKEYADWFHSGFISWTERLELGGSFLEGNTNQEAFNTAAKFSRETPLIATQINIGGNHAQSKQITTANRWFADTTTDFKLGGNWLYFVRSLHEFDQFTNLDYRGTASLGSGYRFFNEENRKLIIRYGPGVTEEIFHSPRLVRTSPDLFGEVETKWLIGPRIVFEEKATFHPNITNFGMLRILNTTGFLIPLDNQKRWNLKVGFRYEYNGRPNANREPSDFATNVNIVYSRN